MDRPEAEPEEPLVSAVRFAELTGMTRERLRAWERRHGFPDPVRRAGGPRRYRLADVQRVVAVRRAHEEGVPIGVAVARSSSGRQPWVGGGAFRSTIEAGPSPVLLVSGPAPLRVEYANAVLRAVPEPPLPGEELVECCPALRESRLVEVVQAHFARELDATDVVHPPWTAAAGTAAVTRSVVFRLPTEPEARPLVAVVGLQTAGEQEALLALAQQEEELAGLRHRAERHERWLDAIAALAEELRDEPAADVVDRALDVLIRQTRAVDGALAVHAGGELAVERSRRGVLRRGRVVVAGDPELAVALRDRLGLWLSAPTSALLGVPHGLHAAGVPAAVGGETLALVVLVFDEVEPYDEDNRRLLAAMSATMGFVLLRDRLAAQLRDGVSSQPARADG